MLGSNRPVCSLGGEFNAVINAYLDGIRTLSAEEQAEILGGTCIRYYNLGSTPLDCGTHCGEESVTADLFPTHERLELSP
jgi:hypothetical protein